MQPLLVLLSLALWPTCGVAGHDRTTEDTPHHTAFELRHFQHHHRHYHHYRDAGKHWVAGLLLALVGAVLGSCAAVGLWRRFCARRPAADAYADAYADAFASDAPLLQPPPLPLAACAVAAVTKEAPPPYKESWA